MPESRETIERRWQTFVDEYVKDWNARRAYEECGCYKARGKSAQVRAFDLLSKDKVQELIREAIEARNSRTHVDQDRVILELARIGFFHGRNVSYWKDDELHLIPSDELSEDDSAAISEISIEIDESENEYGIRRKVKRRFKAHDKLAALDKLARHVGLYAADNARKITFEDEIVQSRERLSKALKDTGERLRSVNVPGHQLGP